MTKYGRRLHFGYCPIPITADPMRPLRLAELAETLGLDYVGVQDRPDYADHHDSWTLLTAIGMTTSRIAIFTNAAGLPRRPLTMLAKAAASLDLLTDGRLEIGLSAGALEARGGEQPSDEARSDEEATAALEDAIEVMRLLWSGERSARADLQPGPAPAHRISIWLAGNEPRMLAVAGRLADGWIPDPYPVVQPDDLAALSQQVDDAAASAGREPSEIRRIWPIAGTIGRAESSTPFQGTAKQWARSLAELAIEVGIDTFLLMEGEDAEDQLQQFALEVMPHARELVDLSPEAARLSGLSRASQGAGASGATPAEEEVGKLDRVDESSMESFPASDPPAS